MKQGFDTGTIMSMLVTVLLAGFTASPAAATQVYTWTDQNGTVQFSDQPPENADAQIIEVEEAYRPGSVSAVLPDANSDTDAEGGGDTPDASQPPTAAQQRRDDLARTRQERRELEEQTERLCTAHRERLEAMEPARRVLYTNEEGEQVRMDDDQRMGMINESKAFLSANCG